MITVVYMFGAMQFIWKKNIDESVYKQHEVPIIY